MKIKFCLPAFFWYIKKIVNLNGGLGNQMFQYAFGVKLSKMCHCSILYDKNWFDTIKGTDFNGVLPNGTYPRKYELEIFNLKLKFASLEYIKKAREMKKTLPFGFLRKMFKVGKYENKIIEEKNPFEYDEDLFHSKKIYYEGYFQNPKYLEGIEDILRKDFTFPDIQDEYNLNILNKIKSCENPVFIHIRRGDYLNLGWELNADYYKKALDFIFKNIKNPEFFVFGTDCEDFFNTFKIDFPVEFIGNHNYDNKEDWKDMYLMSQCKHAIIANSTFSWWGAWLWGDNKERTVIAPSPFVNNQDSIIPDSWRKIEWQKN